MMFGKASTMEASEIKSVANAPQREKCNENPDMDVYPFNAPPLNRLSCRCG